MNVDISDIVISVEPVLFHKYCRNNPEEITTRDTSIDYRGNTDLGDLREDQTTNYPVSE